MFSCSKLRRWTESVSFLVRQINEVCIRLFGRVTFLSYAIIILSLSRPPRSGLYLFNHDRKLELSRKTGIIQGPFS